MSTHAPLNFGLGETADAIRDTTARWAADRLAPLAAEIDESNSFRRELWPEMGELGLHGITVEEEFGGLGLGYLAARLAGLDAKARRALAFEVGMQNSGLAATLAKVHFSPLAALPSAVFSVWHNVSGAVLAAWFARRPVRD